VGRINIGKDTFQAAYDRFYALYAAGHQVVVTFSGGKDSTVCLEMAILAATDAGKLPVQVVTQDEEIAIPGTYEFIERTAARPEVDMTWLVMQHPMVNVFDRECPYFWCFDPLLDPEQWVRQPPDFATWRPGENAIEFITNPERYPVEISHEARRERWADAEEKWPGKQKLVNVMGLRTQESAKRLLGLHSSGGYMTAANDLGVFSCRPIYDWKDADVWKLMNDLKCDYNKAYDVMYRMGMKRSQLRIGPPTLNTAGVGSLKLASKAFPRWFDRVCDRLRGVRLAAQFGSRVCSPYRRKGESWEDCFRRECLGPDVPEWVRDRARTYMEAKLKHHEKHSAAPFPETQTCISCGGSIASWRSMAQGLWGGDPFSSKTHPICTILEPEFFREGAGTWAGTWSSKVKGKIKVMF